MSTTLSEVALETAPVNATVTTQVWDLPLRVFHWSLALAVSAAFVTAWLGGDWMRWHVRVGAFILALLLFRLIWGWIGSTHARFASFVPTPKSVIAYLRGKWHGAGHTPLGALSVVVLLIVLAVQIGTGLFANDDIAHQGPLSQTVSKAVTDRASGWHAALSNLLLAWIVIHTAAIGFYAVVRRTDLVSPMLTGKKQLPPQWASVTTSVSVRRVFVAAALSAVLVVAVFTEWRASPAATAVPAATPDW